MNSYNVMNNNITVYCICREFNIISISIRERTLSGFLSRV